MKLNYFKFQDGKVFWLPEYPENRPVYPVGYDEDDECYSDYEDKLNTYDQAIAQSLASAIEVAPEDADVVKIQIWWHNIWTHELDKQHANQNTFNQIIELWQPENGKVYSAECEMEIKTVYEPLVSKFDLQFGKVPIGTQLSVARQIARLKLKDEIFPAANSHDMKELEDKRKRELADLIEFTDRLAPPDNQDELWREFYKTVLDSPNPEDHIGCSLRETLESKFHITLKS